MTAATPTNSGVVPEAALDRILEALTRSRKYLDAEKQRKLDELFNVDSLLAFGVLLAIWGGLQLTPVGWLADTVLGLWGAYQLGHSLGELVWAAKEAAGAPTDADLETAAQHMARAMTDAAVDVIAAILGAAVFGRLRSLLRGIRGRLLPSGSRFVEAGEGPVREQPNAQQPQAGNGSNLGSRLGELGFGGGVSVGLVEAAPPIGQSIAKVRAWPWVLGGVAGAALLVAGVVSMGRTPTRRPLYG